jgi:ATP synthase, F1 epsilon subunit (delta in mitochondria)
MLEIMTPERLFLRENVRYVTVLGLDGYFTVMKGHMPMVAALQIGEMTIGFENAVKTAVNAEGYMEIRPDRVLIFTQTCEWPEEIDENRALHAKRKAEEAMRQKQSILENKSTKIALTRAMVRLSAKSKNVGKYNQ